MVPLIDRWELEEWWWYFHGETTLRATAQYGYAEGKLCTTVVQSSLAYFVIGESAAKLEWAPDRSKPRGSRRAFENRYEKGESDEACTRHDCDRES